MEGIIYRNLSIGMERNVMLSLPLCRNQRRTAFGNFSATMCWPVRVLPPAIVLAVVVMVGCIGLTMQDSRWMNYIEASNIAILHSILITNDTVQ